MKTTTIGVPVPSEIRSALEKAQGGLHTGEFVAADNMNLGIVDLGEQPDWMIDKMVTALQQVEVGPFYVSIDGLGTTGGNSPTGIFAEIEDAKLLKKLHRQVTRVARVEGVDIPHQKWEPGVLLARFGELEQHDMKQILSFLSRRSGLSLGPFPATEFYLWEITQKDGRTVHEPIETYQLRM